MEHDEIVNTELYSAGVDSVVSDKTGSTCWSKMALWASQQDIDTFLNDVAEVETAIKEHLKISTMPSSWRSAKSVCKKALDYGVALVDTDDNVRGKTQVSLSIRMASETPMSDYDKCHVAFSKGRNIYQKLTDEEKQRIREYFDAIGGLF